MFLGKIKANFPVSAYVFINIRCYHFLQGKFDDIFFQKTTN